MTQRKCKLASCHSLFIPPRSAENKLFCCEAHRREWHAAELREARELARQLREARGQEPKRSGSPKDLDL